MNDEENDRYSAETLRLVQHLDFLVRSKGVSIRSLEKKMGVGDSVFNKLLKGKITLQVRHVLMICDALGIGWKEFFAKAYGLDDEPGDAWERKVMDLLTRLGLLPAAKVGQEAPAAAEDR